MKNKLMSTIVRYALGTAIGFATLVSMMGVSLAQALTINSPNGKDISNVVLYVKTSSGITKVKIDDFSAGSSTKTYNPTSILQKYPGSQLVAYTVKAGSNESNMGPGEGELIILNSSFTQGQLPTGAASSTFKYTEVLKLAETQTSTTPTQTTQQSESNKPPVAKTQTATTSTQTTQQSESNKPPVTETQTATTSTQTTQQSESNNPPVAETQTSTTPTQTTQQSESNNPPVAETQTSTTPTQTTQQSESNNPPVAETQISTTNVQLPLETKNAVTVPEPGTVAALGIFGLGFILKNKKKA